VSTPAPPLKFGLSEAIARVAGLDKPFEVRLEQGDFTFELFVPRGEDTQSPHSRDEIYVTARGTARFRRGGETVEVAAGDALFVTAWEEHRFVEFSEDFATWVIFYGLQMARPGA
jgi:mannose-6-phosphate isomerase-like protein (cupin superfamily)